MIIYSIIPLYIQSRADCTDDQEFHGRKRLRSVKLNSTAWNMYTFFGGKLEMMEIVFNGSETIQVDTAEEEKKSDEKSGPLWKIKRELLIDNVVTYIWYREHDEKWRWAMQYKDLITAIAEKWCDYHTEIDQCLFNYAADDSKQECILNVDDIAKWEPAKRQWFDQHFELPEQFRID